MMVVEIRTIPSFKAGIPKVIFEKTADPEIYQAYDVTPDGKRFLMIKPSESDRAPAHINLVLNWLEELKQRIQVK